MTAPVDDAVLSEVDNATTGMAVRLIRWADRLRDLSNAEPGSAQAAGIQRELAVIADEAVVYANRLRELCANPDNLVPEQNTPQQENVQQGTADEVIP